MAWASSGVGLPSGWGPRAWWTVPSSSWLPSAWSSMAWSTARTSRSVRPPISVSAWIRRSRRRWASESSAWVRAAIVLGLILVIVDGLAAKRIAEAWATAPAFEQPAALRLVLAEATINFALAALFNILFAGVTFILYGLAVAWSRVYPRWLGWVVVAAGIGSVVAGLAQA
jgi:hypothetical protein